MAAGVDRDAAAFGKLFDDAVPAPSMKSGRVSEEESGLRARPFPRGKQFSMGLDDMQLGSAIHYSRLYSDLCRGCSTWWPRPSGIWKILRIARFECWERST